MTFDPAHSAGAAYALDLTGERVHLLRCWGDALPPSASARDAGSSPQTASPAHPSAVYR